MTLGDSRTTSAVRPGTQVVRERLAVDGIVQGVGFRPFVWRLAHALRLNGFMRNTAEGVEIEVEGASEAVADLRRQLAACAPPAVVQRVRGRRIAARGTRGFAIAASAGGHARTDLPPDLATCADCLDEIFDPLQRRYRYPFTNCSRCGPRFTVAEGVPYDRLATTLRDFALCADCAREYNDPSDRRFRAEPIACPRCGPRLWLESAAPISPRPALSMDQAHDAITQAAAILGRGGVVGVLGLGGVHLTCDAADTAAVTRIRAIKQRPLKPLAVMVGTLPDAVRLAELDRADRDLLTSPAAPIVLLCRRPDAPVAADVAPGIDRIGVMLPYTPLHHLLAHDTGRPLVMTSANRPGEPIASTADEARLLVGDAVDALLLHDRPIHQRCDDGVWMTTHRGAQPLRRSRGSAPARLAVPVRPPRAVLGVGGDLKNAFCLLDRRGAVMSQYIGAMELAATQTYFRHSLAKLERLTGVNAAVAACDLHPDYASRRLAEQLGLPLVAVQHHHAHVAACLAEHGRRGAAIGVAFDGTGYGTDGAIWGGEVLIADLHDFHRVGHLEYLPLPGGDAAIRHPARLAAAYLLALFGEVREERLRAVVGPSTIAILQQMIARKINTVATSSAGRLFDVVAALLGIADEATYEGQAAMQLEALARRGASPAGNPQTDGYPFDVAAGVVGLRPLLAAILRDRDCGVAAAVVARRFHRTMAAIVRALARHARALSGLDIVALSGGCFQNQLLLDDSLALLAEDGFDVLVHALVPANDGGLALGQAVVAAARLEEGGACA